MVTAQYGLKSAGRFCQHFTVNSPVPGQYKMISGCSREMSNSGGLHPAVSRNHDWFARQRAAVLSKQKKKMTGSLLMPSRGSILPSTFR